MSRPPDAVGARADVARTAGRGVLYITFAKLFFIAAGYAIHFALPRLLEAKALYGVYGVVSSVLNVLTMVVIQSTVQAVSKLVSEDESRAADVRRASLRVQAWVGGGLSVAYFAAADLIADFQRDEALALYFRISSAVVLAYGFYAVFIGVLNGRKEFHKQALFDMSFAALKMAFVVGAAALGLSMTGVFAGFSLAAVLIFLAAAAVVGFRGGVAAPELQRRLFGIMLPVMLYTAVVSLLLTADLWMLKRLLGTESGDVVADYTAAQVIARIPYQATLAVTFVVFPLVSRATFEGDREATASYVRITLRYSLVVLAAMVSILGGAAQEVVIVVYPKAYASAAAALEWLAGGMLLFALFSILGAVITGSGRPVVSMGLGVGALAAQVGLCALLVPRFGSVGAAAATGGALFLACAAAMAFLWSRYRAGLPALSAVRVLVAGAVVVALARWLPVSGVVLTVAKCVGLAVAYFAVLILLRELGRDDWTRVARVFRRRAAAKEAV